MNYAEDRLDRRARHPDGLQLLWKDYRQALAAADQSLLAKTLRDSGWNRHALFHFGQAWIQNSDDWMAAADYAQMAELAGFPALGMIAIWVFRTGGTLLDPAKKVTATNTFNDPSWLEQDEPTNRDCGCGNYPSCGGTEFYVPFRDDAIEQVLSCLEECLHAVEGSRDGQVSANSILQRQQESANSSLQYRVANKNPLMVVVPREFAFWQTSNSELRVVPPPLQLLLIKLLYATLPVLAAVSVAHVSYDAPTAQLLATDYKSHWAYYVLIRSLVLGERIKPSRRHSIEYYHVPVWDLLWQLDWRRDYCHADGLASLLRESEPPVTAIVECLDRLRQSLLGRPMTLFSWFPTTSSIIPPLFFVGDSHVLSLAWQEIHLHSSCNRRVVPVLVTGLKAWHVRRQTNFFTQTCFRSVLRQLASSSHRIRTVVVSAGEIDCREGIGGPLLQGYGCSPEHEQQLVQRTVSEYTTALVQIAQSLKLQILVVPVPPHLHNSKGRIESRRARRATTKRWNQELRRQLQPCTNNVYFVDYEATLLDSSSLSTSNDDLDSYVLKPALNADSTHMNSAFARHFEQAVADCGCNLDLL
jgi:hypothetical protein